jgi:type IV pilus assembly protein PilP
MKAVSSTTVKPQTPLVGVPEKIAPPKVEIYSYNPQGKTDPFKPLYVEKPPAPPHVLKARKKEDDSKKTPLERIELAQLKLVAVVWDIPEPRALVEGPKGEGFILSVGTPIGKNYGIVSRINSSGVVVMEKIETPEGKFKNIKKTLKLYEE